MLYLVLEIWSNSEDGTSSVPKLFEKATDARSYYEKILETAITDFIYRGYCSDNERDDIMRWFHTGMNSDDEVRTDGSLMYNFKDGIYYFWNLDLSQDFGYSIETHQMLLS